MYCVGWDIGIKNLAYCIIEIDENKNEKIVDMNIISLIDDPKIYKCTEINKNKSSCKSNASYFNLECYYCNRHFNKLDKKAQKGIKK